MNSLGNKLRRLRQQRRWTQRELGDRASISTPHISSMERGLRNPSLVYAERLANAFKVPLEYFCTEHKSMSLEDLLPVAHSFSPTLHKLMLNESFAPYSSTVENLKCLDEEGRQVVDALISALAKKDNNKVTELDL